MCEHKIRYVKSRFIGKIGSGIGVRWPLAGQGQEVLEVINFGQVSLSLINCKLLIFYIELLKFTCTQNGTGFVKAHLQEVWFH